MPALPDLIRKFETAPLPELLEAVKRPSAAEAAALELWLGKARFESLRRRAVAGGTRGGARRGPRPNAVVLHGIMGAELTVRKGKDDDLVWVHAGRLALGQITRLKMKPDGTPEHDSFASGMMRKYYLELLLGLAEDANVQAFHYDWRRDLNDSAGELHDRIQEWFGGSAPVLLAAHSMGGLVARTWIKNHRARWDKGCRLVMMGTPNHGSFAIPQVITGAHKMVRKLAALDLRHRLASFTAVLNTFPGSLQMLPSPLVMPDMRPLYEAATWSGRGVSQVMLDRARRHHELLAGVIVPDRMAYIAGYNHPTADGVRDLDWSGMAALDGYTFTSEGDETVPHLLGFLDKVPVRYSPATHGDLPNDPDVVSAVRQYLAGEPMSALATAAPVFRGRTRSLSPAQQQAAQEEEIAEFAALARGLRTRSARGAAAALDLQAQLLRGFMGGGSTGPDVSTAGADAAPPPPRGPRKRAAAAPAVKPLHLRLVLGSIAGAGRLKYKSLPVDFLTAGHYTGYEPTASELALDQLLSHSLGLTGEKECGDAESAGHLYLTQATRRGALSIQLGEPCLFPLPGKNQAVALMGLGPPGEFGTAELRVALEEFLPAIARLGCRHLAAVLVGAGKDNLEIPAAVECWLQALDTVQNAGLPHPRCVTFVEHSPLRAFQMDVAFRALMPNYPSMNCGDPAPSLETLRRMAEEEARQQALRRLASLVPGQPDRRHSRTPRGATPADSSAARKAPTYVNISRHPTGFEFSAITNSAAIPQRIIKLDPALVADISTRLSLATGDACQEWGRTLEKLLIPRDLRAKVFSSAAPVVLALDAATARIPWEMLRLPHAAGSGAAESSFLSTAPGYGVTRQFRTVFAPAPELNRGANRDLRFLIVADPAEDAPLEGAQQEALAIERILQEFKTRHEAANPGCTVHVEVLLGPSQATRADVINRLTNQRYDVIHFAGHCYYDAADPEQNGWIFHEERHERITAAELSRLDCVPPFVFSNACESGVTPDRSGSGLALAPAFAEAFFMRGVRNFICSAWPVDDAAAEVFARTFYTAFLGTANSAPAAIREAVRLARCATQQLPDDTSNTWGAYQHYGNPEFRLVTD